MCKSKKSCWNSETNLPSKATTCMNAYENDVSNLRKSHDFELEFRPARKCMLICSQSCSSSHAPDSLRITCQCLLAWQQWFCPAFHFGNMMDQYGPNASYPVQSASATNYVLLRLRNAAVFTSSDATSHVHNRDTEGHHDHRIVNFLSEDSAKHVGAQHKTCIIYTWNIDPCTSTTVLP